MDHMLLQPMVPRRVPLPQTSSFRKSLQCQPPQDQHLLNLKMVDITFAVLGQHSSQSKYLDDDNCLPRYLETDPPKGTLIQSIEIAVQIHDRRVFDGSRSPLFDNVQITLHGAIKTDIGKHKAFQKILQATEQLTWLDFASCSEAQCIDEARSASMLCATASFMKNGTRLPSSTVITGSKYVTEQTVLSDQHLVAGRCEVEYWITAEFSTTPETECLSIVPRLMSSPLDLSFRPSSVHIEPSTLVTKLPTRLRLRESCNSIFAYCGYNRYAPRQPTDISLSIPKMAPTPLMRSGGHDHPTCVIPVTMTITIPSPTSAADAMRSTLLRHHLLQKGLKGIVSLSADLHSNRRFGVGIAATDHMITTHLSSTVANNVNLDIPPFYVQNSEEGEEYTATTYVNLNIPEALISSCSLESNLLRTTHMLNLALSTTKLEMGSVPLLPVCSAKVAADCSLS